MTVIEVDHIKKSFGKVTALQDLGFSVKKGTIFGLIGPDGSGKTTLIRILTTLLLADSGTASILGYDVVRDYKIIRSSIGYMPGKFSLYEDLSVEENLGLFASIFGTTIEENYHLVKDIYQQIEPFKTRKAGKLSGGMKQKLALSCAMIHAPELIFLDEPTTGVDPVSRKEFWQMLARLKENGISILVSTPYMDEASLCDEVGLIQNGALMDIDKPSNIIQKFDKKLWAISGDNKNKLIHDLRKYHNCHSAFLFGEHIHYTSKKNTANMEELQNYVGQLGHKDLTISPISPSIEDCFMDLMHKNDAHHAN